MINTAEFSKGFWVAAGVLAVLLVVSLLTGVFKKVA